MFDTTEAIPEVKPRRRWTKIAVVIVAVPLLGCVAIVAWRLLAYRAIMLRTNRLYESGRYQAAEVGYREAAAVLPADGLAHLYRGEALLMLKRPEEARQEMKQAVAEEPDDAHYWVRYGMAEWASGDRPGAERELRKALSMNPNEGEGHAILANLLNAQKRYQEAWQELREARRCRPQDESLKAAISRFQAHHPELFDSSKGALDR